MKSELEKKLNKLPVRIITNNIAYVLNISKADFYDFHNKKEKIVWEISYVDPITKNELLYVNHNSIQAAVDNTLSEIKHNTLFNGKT